MRVRSSRAEKGVKANRIKRRNRTDILFRLILCFRDSKPSGFNFVAVRLFHYC